MLVTIDNRSWWIGYMMGAGHLRALHPRMIPDDVDSFSYHSGYIEGKATMFA